MDLCCTSLPPSQLEDLHSLCDAQDYLNLNVDRIQLAELVHGYKLPSYEAMEELSPSRKLFSPANYSHHLTPGASGFLGTYQMSEDSFETIGNSALTNIGSACAMDEATVNGSMRSVEQNHVMGERKFVSDPFYLTGRDPADSIESGSEGSDQLKAWKQQTTSGSGGV